MSEANVKTFIVRPERVRYAVEDECALLSWMEIWGWRKPRRWRCRLTPRLAGRRPKARGDCQHRDDTGVGHSSSGYQTPATIGFAPFGLKY